MVQLRNVWNEALRLRSALMALGIEEGEIAFPAGGRGGDSVPYFVSETISASAELTPSMARAVQATLRSFRPSLEGRTVQYWPDRVDLHQGDSGTYLEAWGGNSVA